MTEVAFSHRPQAGISIGVAVIGDVALLSATFLNPLDTFSGPQARRIIRGRIERTSEGSSRRFTTAVPVTGDINGRDIMQRLRGMFKPDPQENDDTFAIEGEVWGVESRTSMPRDMSWAKLTDMFQEAANAACVS